MAESLALKTARLHVGSFKHESDRVMQDHFEAMDCLNCEAFLQLGIDAFEWLLRADRGVRMAVSEGKIPHDPDFDRAIRNLCENWLPPCELAEKWVEVQKKRGYTISNLEEFRRCQREMQAIVEAYQDEDRGEVTLPGPIADLRDEAIQEHLNGQTAEFI